MPEIWRASDARDVLSDVREQKLSFYIIILF